MDLAIQHMYKYLASIEKAYFCKAELNKTMLFWGKLYIS